jgi:hypothetical protein
VLRSTTLFAFNKKRERGIEERRLARWRDRGKDREIK